jgi:diguanylate cyclase (GGDEF)-like protein/PAS domain S-box-containing protein
VEVDAVRSSGPRREAVIPAGHELSLVEFRSRHRALMLLAGAEAAALGALGVVGATSWALGVAVPAVIALLLVVAASRSAGRSARSLAVILALLAGALGVLHLVDGGATGQLAVAATMAVVVVYESWRLLAAGIGVIAVHHLAVDVANLALVEAPQRGAWTVGQIMMAVVVGGAVLLVVRSADADRRRMLESGARPTYSIDEQGGIQHANRAMAEFFGVPIGRLIGANDHDLFHLGGRETCEICTAVENGQGTAVVLAPLLGPAGEPFDAEVTVRPVGGPRRRIGATVTLTDVSSRVASQRRLEQAARTDSLTGLGNRFLLEHDLGTVIDHEAELGRRVGTFHVDVDRFKPVNDTLGHAAGDRLLVQLAERIRSIAPPDALIARVGGDEFVVVVPDADAEEILACAEAVRGAIEAPVEIDGRTLSITASVGVLVVSATRTSPEALIADVDLALQRAKRAGGNRVVRFDLEMRAQADARVALVSDLHAAVANDEFELYFQPAWDVRTERIDGCEALLRWHHPERGLIMPACFIPLAEQSGMIVEIGRWVLAEACRRADAWFRDPAVPDLRVAVNVSAAQLRDPGLVVHVDALLAEVAFPADHLVLELTETMLMEDPEAAVPVLHELRDRGVTLAIDDFGTGFSSLAMLRRLPVHEVKIDRQFLEEITTDRVGQRVVSSVIDLARALDLRVVAEGIESFEALEVARRLGADRAQGYALGKPMRAEAFDAHLREKWGGRRLLTAVRSA